MSPMTRFVRALEAEYQIAVAARRRAGGGSEKAHRLAFQHVKARAAQALETLRRAGVHPFAEASGTSGVPDGAGEWRNG